MSSLNGYFFFIAVPFQAPSNFDVIEETSTSVMASWQPPSSYAVNGNITGFKLFYRKQSTNNHPIVLEFNSSKINSTDVTGLSKYTLYEFQVLAFTKDGDGRKSLVEVVRTKEDGKMVGQGNKNKIYRLSLFTVISIYRTQRLAGRNK